MSARRPTKSAQQVSRSEPKASGDHQAGQRGEAERRPEPEREREASAMARQDGRSTKSAQQVSRSEPKASGDHQAGQRGEAERRPEPERASAMARQDWEIGLPEALERAASALPRAADAIRPANGDPGQLARGLAPADATAVLAWLLEHEPSAGMELALAWA